MISIEISDVPDNKWNERLLGTGLGTIYQTREMSQIIQKQGNTPLFVKFINNAGNIVGQLLITINSRFEKKGITGSILKNTPIFKKNIYKWTYGPIIFDGKYTDKIYTKLGEFLISKNCRVSGWEHPLSPSSISILKDKFQTQMWCTFLIDLNKPKEELWGNVDKHSGRKNIERSIKRGVRIEEINEKNLIEYYDLRKKEDDSIKDFNYFLEWWRTFKPIGYSGFLTKNDDVVLGGLLFSFFDKHVIEGGVTRSVLDYEQKLYSQDLIKWKIIEWGLENGMNYYNLAGANPQPKSDKERGIMRYKEKWGGKRYDYWIIRK